MSFKLKKIIGLKNKISQWFKMALKGLQKMPDWMDTVQCKQGLKTQSFTVFIFLSVTYRSATIPKNVDRNFVSLKQSLAPSLS